MCHPLGMPNPGERLGFNLVHKKCSPQNYKRGGGLGGSKVGWVGPKLGGWVFSKIPPPPLINEAWLRSWFITIGGKLASQNANIMLMEKESNVNFDKELPPHTKLCRYVDNISKELFPGG